VAASVSDLPHRQALRLLSATLPELVRGLRPARIFFDGTRRARRLKQPPRRWANPPKGFPPAHRHSTFEMCFLLAGRCPFLLGEERRELKRGDMVVLSADAYHRELAAERCGPYRLLWLGCLKKSVTLHIQNHVGGGRFDNDLRITIDDIPEALQIAETVDYELWAGRPGAFHRIQGMLLQLFGILEGAWHEQNTPRPAAKTGEKTQKWRVKAAAEYVRDHFAHHLDLDEVAAHVGVSSTYLSALFTRALGRSFTDFLAACRLEEAERLLGDPALSVKEIAQRVGLDNPFYFSRLFRKHTGMSPRQFRQRQAGRAKP